MEEKTTVGRPWGGVRGALKWAAVAAACAVASASAGAATLLTVAGQPAVADLQCPQYVQPSSKPKQPSSPAPDPITRSAVAGILALPDAVPQHMALGRKAAAGPARIGFWGDSHLAAAFFTEEMVLAMGWQAGQVKPSFLPPTMGRPGVRLPIRKHCKSPDWRFVSALASQKAGRPTGPGLLHLQSSQAGAELMVDFRHGGSGPALQNLNLHVQAVAAGGLRLALRVDQGPEQELRLPEGETELQLQASRAFSQLQLRVLEGELNLEGFAPDYVAAAGLVLDVFGIPGAVARSWNAVDASHMQRRLGAAPYDVVMLEYGTNEGNDSHFRAAAYRSSMRGTVAALRASFPQAQCVLLAPTDRGRLPQRGQAASTGTAQWLHYSRVHAEIAGIQQEVAQENGCAFWDWQAAMGGAGGAYKWFFNNPQWMARDLIHLTPAGYRESARRFVRDMGLREWQRP